MKKETKTTSANELDDMLRGIYGRTLKDILVAGYIDTLDSVKRFHPMFEDVYFDFDGIILRASSIQQFWYLDLEVIDKIERRFELEDDDEFAVCSLEFILTSPTGPNIVQSLIAFVAQDELAGNSNIVCAALEFDCGDAALAREVVFLNTRNEFGIHLGTRAALEDWRRENALATVPFIEQLFPIDIEVQNQK